MKQSRHFPLRYWKKIMKNRKKVNNSTKTVFSSKLVLFLCFPMTKSCKWNIYIPFNTSSIFALICQKKTNFVIPIQIDSKSRVCKFSKHLKILKMRSLEGCETKFMQNFGFFKPFFKGFWPIIWAINPLCGVLPAWTWVRIRCTPLNPRQNLAHSP